MKRTSTGAVWLGLLMWCLVAAPAWGEEVRVEVAILDGEPVCHWRIFKSVLPDDVDRALVLRAFQRKHFKVPEKLVNDAVQRTVQKDFAGDYDKFTQNLRREGALVDDFKRFTCEEIILQAMRCHDPKLSSVDLARQDAEYLVELRAGANVKMLNANP